MVRRIKVARICYTPGIVLRDANTFIYLILQAAVQVDTLVPTLQIRRLRPKEAKIISVRLYGRKWQHFALHPGAGVWRDALCFSLILLFRHFPCWMTETLERRGVGHFPDSQDLSQPRGGKARVGRAGPLLLGGAVGWDL